MVSLINFSLRWSLTLVLFMVSFTMIKAQEQKVEGKWIPYVDQEVMESQSWSVIEEKALQEGYVVEDTVVGSAIRIISLEKEGKSHEGYGWFNIRWDEKEKYRLLYEKRSDGQYQLQAYQAETMVKPPLLGDWQQGQAKPLPKEIAPSKFSDQPPN